ncbi:MAG: DUF898 domain-containing protein [Burkholderiales bacterium]|nr:DUF898 domain-containing protein [Burkholderiales bacterium]
MDNGGTTPKSLPVRFVGSGSEYFRIWIVNLLLTLVTIGLYYPFAKVRRLRYLHGATEIGSHAMSFHADPWKMLRGYLLVAAMAGAYSGANYFSPTAGLVALLIVGAVWPALWHSSMRFRLANTGWRGLRFRFTGSRGGAYAVMLSWVLIVFVFAALGALLAPERGSKPGLGDVLAGLLPLIVVGFVPALLWWVRRYQHDHYALGGEASRFSAGVGSFYGVFALAALMFLGIIAVIGVAAAFLVPALFGGGKAGGGLGAGLVIAGVLGVLLYLAVLILVGAFVGARLQNLVWNGTRSQHIAFDSRLTMRSLAGLTMKNWLLIVLTVGLYYPFATVAMARLRLQAVQVVFAVDPDTLVAVASQIDESAAGDAAGDLFGFDIGL